MAATARVILLKTVLDQTLLTIPLLLVFFPYMSWCQGQQVSFKRFIVCHNLGESPYQGLLLVESAY